MTKQQQIDTLQKQLDAANEQIATVDNACALFDDDLEMDKENHYYCKRCDKCKQAEVK